MLLNQNDTVSHRGLWVDRKEKGIFMRHLDFGIILNFQVWKDWVRVSSIGYRIKVEEA